MTFVNVGTLGVVAGRRDELLAILTRRSDVLRDLGCRAYEVGVNNESPDTVLVVESWESADAHQHSLAHDDVRTAIAETRPLLSGELGGFRFDVVGSPLRDG